MVELRNLVISVAGIILWRNALELLRRPRLSSRCTLIGEIPSNVAVSRNEYASRGIGAGLAVCFSELGAICFMPPKIFACPPKK